MEEHRDQLAISVLLLALAGSVPTPPLGLAMIAFLSVQVCICVFPTDGPELFEEILFLLSLVLRNAATHKGCKKYFLSRSSSLDMRAKKWQWECFEGGGEILKRRPLVNYFSYP